MAENSDLIRGYEAIGKYLGDQSARQAEHLARSRAGLPTFKIGNAVCARKSSLDAWIAEREAKALAEAAE